MRRVYGVQSCIPANAPLPTRWKKKIKLKPQFFSTLIHTPYVCVNKETMNMCELIRLIRLNRHLGAPVSLVTIYFTRESYKRIGSPTIAGYATTKFYRTVRLYECAGLRFSSVLTLSQATGICMQAPSNIQTNGSKVGELENETAS